jgi:superfamily II DNA or RNA helicase
MLHASSFEPQTKPAVFVAHVRIYAEPLLIEDDEAPGGYRELTLPVLSLELDYDGVRFRPGDERSGVFRASPAGNAWLPRDRAAEARAGLLLESLGALDLGCVEHVIPGFDSRADYLIRTDADPHAACSFLAHAVPELRARGYEVAIDPDFPWQVVAPDAGGGWSCRLERDGDWFSLELGVMVGGERVDLLPALLEWLRRCPDSASLDALVRVPARYCAVPVGPNRYLPVDPARLRRVLAVLVELYRGERCLEPIAAREGKHAALRLPRLRSGALARLERALPEIDWQGDLEIVGAGRTLDGRPETLCAPPGLRATLRDYQLRALEWLDHLRRVGAGGVLADDMGLGKTLQAIALLAREKAERRLDRPSLVVAPTSLAENWRRELARFAPHLRTLVLCGPGRHARHPLAARAEVVITTYPVLVRDVARLEKIDWHYVILDEAQTIKNPKSLAASSARRLQARHRLCLTGTPIENDLDELWSLFEFLMPGVLGEPALFRRHFRLPIERDRDELALGALRDRLGAFVLRRTKEQVATELPPKTILVHPVELEADQRDLYESIRISAHAEVRRAIESRGFSASAVTVLDALMKLRQVCCDPRLVKVPAARAVERSAKFEAFFELLERQLAEGRAVLVFSQFTRMLALLSEGLLARGIRHLTLTGETVHRQERVDDFERGRADVFLISLKAGGTGLNLTRADTVIHYDPWWNAAAQAQATDRAHRIGQTKPVFVHNLVALGSVEQRMLALQQRKARLAESLLGSATEPPLIRPDEVERLLAPLDEPG